MGFNKGFGAVRLGMHEGLHVLFSPPCDCSFKDLNRRFTISGLRLQPVFRYLMSRVPAFDVKTGRPAQISGHLQNPKP